MGCADNGLPAKIKIEISKVNHSKKSNNELGAAFMEFALVVPVLILLFIGITELGRAFSAKTSFNNNAYWATRVGAGVAPSIRPVAMQSTFAKLHSINNPKSMIESVSFATDDSDADVVTTNASGAMRVLTNSNALGIHVSYNSSALVPLPISEDFAHPANTGEYGCDGQPGAAPPNGNCEPTQGSYTPSGNYSCNGGVCIGGGAGEGNNCPSGTVYIPQTGGCQSLIGETTNQEEHIQAGQ